MVRVKGINIDWIVIRDGLRGQVLAVLLIALLQLFFAAVNQSPSHVCRFVISIFILSSLVPGSLAS